MSDFIIIISYFFFWNIQHRRRKTRSILSVEKKSKNNENGNHTRRMLSGNDKERQIKPIEHASWNAINAIYVTFNGFWCLLKVKLWTIYTYLERAVGFVCECMRVACNATKRPRATKKNTQSLVEQSISWSIRITVFIWFGLKPTRSGFFNQTHNKQYLFIDQCVEYRALHRWAIYSGFPGNS